MFVTADFAPLFLDRYENTSVTLNNDVKFVAEITSTEDLLTLGIELESEALRDEFEVLAAEFLQLFCEKCISHQLGLDLASNRLEIRVGSCFWLLFQGVNAFL